MSLIPLTAGSLAAAIRRDAASGTAPLRRQVCSATTGRLAVGAAEAAREALDAGGVGTTERVDRLVGIADHDQLAAARRRAVQQRSWAGRCPGTRRPPQRRRRAGRAPDLGDRGVEQLASEPGDQVRIVDSADARTSRSNRPGRIPGQEPTPRQSSRRGRPAAEVVRSGRPGLRSAALSRNRALGGEPGWERRGQRRSGQWEPPWTDVAVGASAGPRLSVGAREEIGRYV